MESSSRDHCSLWYIVCSRTGAVPKLPLVQVGVSPHIFDKTASSGMPEVAAYRHTSSQHKSKNLQFIRRRGTVNNFEMSSGTSLWRSNSRKGMQLLQWTSLAQLRKSTSSQQSSTQRPCTVFTTYDFIGWGHCSVMKCQTIKASSQIYEPSS